MGNGKLMPAWCERKGVRVQVDGPGSASVPKLVKGYALARFLARWPAQCCNALNTKQSKQSKERERGELRKEASQLQQLYKLRWE